MQNFNLTVIKRDSRREPFNKDKIINAIIKAMKKVNYEDYDDAYTVTEDILALIYYNFENEVSIEDIEKVVETVLMGFNKKIAREYTSYRSARDSSRLRSSKLVKKINGLMNGSDRDIVAENANKNANRIHIQRDLLAGTVSREIAMDLHMIPPRVEKAVLDYYLHYHK